MTVVHINQGWLYIFFLITFAFSPASSQHVLSLCEMERPCKLWAMAKKFLFYVVVADKISEAPQRLPWSEEWKPVSERVGRKLEWGDWCSLLRERERMKMQWENVSSEKKNSSLMQPFLLNLKRQAFELRGAESREFSCKNQEIFLEKERKKIASALCLFLLFHYPSSPFL